MKSPDEKRYFSSNGKVTKSNVTNNPNDISVESFNFDTSNDEGQNGNNNNIMGLKRFVEQSQRVKDMKKKLEEESFKLKRFVCKIETLEKRCESFEVHPYQDVNNRKIKSDYSKEYTKIRK